MGDLQWTYNRELALQAGLDPLPPVVEALYKVSSVLSAHFAVWKASFPFLSKYRKCALKTKEILWVPGTSICM